MFLRSSAELAVQCRCVTEQLKMGATRKQISFFAQFSAPLHSLRLLLPALCKRNKNRFLSVFGWLAVSKTFKPTVIFIMRATLESRFKTKFRLKTTAPNFDNQIELSILWKVYRTWKYKEQKCTQTKTWLYHVVIWTCESSDENTLLANWENEYITLQ